MKMPILKMLALALISSCFWLLPFSAAETRGADIEAMVPESADAMIRLGSLSSLYDHLSVTETTFFGEPIEDLSEIKEELGFNPFSLAELEQNGIAVSKPLAIVINSLRWSETEEGPKPDFSIMIPVTDYQKAKDRFLGSLKSENPETKIQEKNGFTHFTIPGEEGGYIGKKGDYLLLANSPEEEGAGYMEAILNPEKKLSKNELYREIKGGLDADEDIFAYINIKKIAETQMAALKKLLARAEEDEEGAKTEANMNLESLKDARGMGFTLNLDSPDLMLRSLVKMVPGSKTLKMMENIQFDKSVVFGIRENPMLLLSLGIDPALYYQMMIDAMPPERQEEFDSELSEIKAQYGIDIKADLIDNFGGSFNLGIYDGASINMMNYNTLISANIKDPAKMNGVIEKFMAKLPPEQQSMIVKSTYEGVPTYTINVMGMMQVYIGIKGNNLILSVGQPMYQKALNADAGAGFIANIDDPKLKAVLTDKTSNIFYLNAVELGKAVRNFWAMIQQMKQVPPPSQEVWGMADHFKYLLSTTTLKGADGVGLLTLKTDFSKPFLKGVLDVKETLKKMEEKSEAGQKPVQ